MKLILLGLVLCIFLATEVYAAPVLDSVEMYPPNPWIGQDVDVTVFCTDNANKTIEGVTGKIQSPSISHPPISFNYANPEYALNINNNYLNEIGQYSILINCTNNESESASSTQVFTVSQLSSMVDSIDPSPAYTGDNIIAHIFVYKDTTKLNEYSNIVFDVYLNNQIIINGQPAPYHTGKGYFIITIPSQNVPSNPGVYPLEIVAFYDGNTVVNETSIEVKRPIEFNLINVDKDLVKSGDAITLTVNAKDRGNKIFMQEENLGIKINSVDVDIKKITESGNDYKIEITASSFDAGEYELSVYFSYDGFSATKYHDIAYGVEISGLALEGNKGDPFSLKFKSRDGTQTTINVDSKGEYSGFLEAGTYDLTLTHPKSTLFLSNVTIDEFDDPIKYIHQDGGTVKGIISAGLYIYEIALDYTTSEFEMKYNDKMTYDETDVLVYQCNNWNSGQGNCVSDWEEVDAEIDTVRNTITIENEGMSTFVIGNKQKMKIDLPVNTLKFNSGDPVEFTGIVTDSLNAPLVGAVVTLKKNDIEMSSTESGTNGMFSFSFLPEEDEGIITYTVETYKDPYEPVKKVVSVEIEKIKSISILITDTVRVPLGDLVLIKATIVNTGQV
ncbi:MAG: carboxypeptidase-like regulatory domain-containing protein, partial [Nanoarchaeota archaeon]|nr:carboxypeptidase-like regulatory domain-containing protein [Nanoarchaeota archaeon]